VRQGRVLPQQVLLVPAKLFAALLAAHLLLVVVGTLPSSATTRPSSSCGRFLGGGMGGGHMAGQQGLGGEFELTAAAVEPNPAAWLQLSAVRSQAPENGGHAQTWRHLSQVLLFLLQPALYNQSPA